MGAFMIGFTVVIHAFVCDYILRFIQTHKPPFSRILRRYWKIPTLISAVFFIGSALMIDIWLWAGLLMYVEPNTLNTIEKSLYFATVSFTTVGYGEIVLSENWRILSAITSINGMILFGWSTAFIFEIMAKLYQEGRYHGKRHREPHS